MDGPSDETADTRRAAGGSAAAAVAVGRSQRQRRPRRTPGLRIDPSDRGFRAFVAAAELFVRYHRYELFHVERLVRLLDAGRRVIVVGNHALNIVDPLVFIATLFRRAERVPRFIGHESGWFRVPVLRDISAKWEIIPSRDVRQARAALRRDGFLMLFPGGNSESGLRSYRDEPYRLKWGKRRGFLELALQTDAELIFAAAVGNDESYYQTRIAMPKQLLNFVVPGSGERYAGMPFTVGLLGAQLIPGVFPLPVKLTHTVSEPLDLGDRAAALADPAVFDVLHTRIWGECQRLLDAAVAHREGHTDRLDRLVRHGEAVLQQLGV